MKNKKVALKILAMVNQNSSNTSTMLTEEYLNILNALKVRKVMGKSNRCNAIFDKVVKYQMKI